MSDKWLWWTIIDVYEDVKSEFFFFEEYHRQREKGVVKNINSHVPIFIVLLISISYYYHHYYDYDYH